MSNNPVPTFLGLECGGTRSVALLAGADERCLARLERNGAANLRLLTEAQLFALLRGIAAGVPQPAAVGIGMAGVLEEAERLRLRATAGKIWRGIPCWAGNDLETALAAAEEPQRGSPGVRVVVISGTGASCFGRRSDGTEAHTGGWGHLLGDRGSAYDIALKASQAVHDAFDRTGSWPALGQRILRALQLNTPNDFIGWIQQSAKLEIAALAIEVFAAASEGDRLAKAVLDEAALALARMALACAGRLSAPGKPVEFVFTGSVLLKQPAFARRVKGHLLACWPRATIRPLQRESAWGAVLLARQHWQLCHAAHGPVPGALSRSRFGAPPVGGWDALPPKGRTPSLAPPPNSSFPLPVSRGLSPTETRNPRSKHLDQLSVSAAVRLMLKEDAKIPAALLREEKKIVAAIQIISDSLRAGGRLVYVGAGTSGRIGLLDASECPPTFSVSPETVQAIMAGGREALWGSFEAAEDDAAAGAQAVTYRGVSARDVVVGIAASGRTPFVWGALHEARKAGAKTILVCFNPELEFSPETSPTLVIAPQVGPEILTGSTRLKAGTATKLLLNLFSTLSMVRLAKVVENLMVDVRPTNAKLRDRAVRILRELTGASAEQATQALERSRWSVKRALARLSARKGR